MREGTFALDGDRGARHGVPSDRGHREHRRRPRVDERRDEAQPPSPHRTPRSRASPQDDMPQHKGPLRGNAFDRLGEPDRSRRVLFRFVHCPQLHDTRHAHTLALHQGRHSRPHAGDVPAPSRFRRREQGSRRLRVLGERRGDNLSRHVRRAAFKARLQDDPRLRANAGDARSRLHKGPEVGRKNAVRLSDVRFRHTRDRGGDDCDEQGARPSQGAFRVSVDKGIRQHNSRRERPPRCSAPVCWREPRADLEGTCDGRRCCVLARAPSRYGRNL